MARFEELEETHAEVKTEADTVGGPEGVEQWL